MCGIFGLITLKKEHNKNFFELTTNRTIKLLSNRGPDSNGYWLDENEKILLVHTRLEIVGLGEKGNQPMISNSGRFVISFNGEIYNYKELNSKNSNKSNGSLSDTQILLESFEEFGIEKTLSKIEGMFAMGVWDRKEKSLYLIRDRYGEKPLYYELGNIDIRCIKCVCYIFFRIRCYYKKYKKVPRDK